MALQTNASGQSGVNTAQIDQQIRYETQKLNDYKSKKTNYNTALNYTKKMLTGLNESLKYVNTASDNLKRTFTISGKTADAGSVEKVRDEVQAMIKETNSMVSQMNQAIKELTNSINYTQNEINKLKRKKAAML